MTVGNKSNEKQSHVKKKEIKQNQHFIYTFYETHNFFRFLNPK